MMRKYLFSAVVITAIALIPGSSVRAQEKPDKEKSRDKLGEYDEIIIKSKEPGKNGKVTIEIKDGEVKVDGKPIEEYNGENLSVRKQNATRFRMMAPSSPFRDQKGVWSFDGEGGEEVAFLGVSTDDAPGGVKVLSVTENSAAEAAGLKKGDVISKINDVTIDNPEELTKVITKYKPKEKITVTYKRDGKENKLTATLGKRKNMFMGGNFDHMQPGGDDHFQLEGFKDFNFENDGKMGQFFSIGGKPRLGIKAQDTEEGKGVKVLEVDEDSPADKAGIKEDDVITSFEGKTVNSADELANAARDFREKSSLKVELTRDGKPQTVEVKIPRKLKTANL